MLNAFVYPDYNFDAKRGTIEYYLGSAVMWKDFSNLTINLYLDEDMPIIKSSNLEFEKVDTRTYQYVSDMLPVKNTRAKTIGYEHNPLKSPCIFFVASLQKQTTIFYRKLSFVFVFFSSHFLFHSSLKITAYQQIFSFFRLNSIDNILAILYNDCSQQILLHSRQAL